MAIDYRQLNKKTKPDSYPIPYLWSIVQKAAGKKYILALDLHWGFWNLPLHPASQEYTAFITPFGLYEWTVLPFGLRNAAGEFQRAVDAAFARIPQRCLSYYIDDITISGNEWTEVIETLRSVLQACITSGLYIKLSKAQLNGRSAKVLGFIVSENGIQPNPVKIAAIQGISAPQNRKQLKGFLGMVGFWQRHVPNYATLTAPLTDLLKKGTEYAWAERQQQAFHQIKEAVQNALLLAAPIASNDYTIATDASDVGLGATLMQEQRGALEILECAAKKLSPAERRWTTREKEGFAIKWALQKFYPYVRGTSITLLTDHQSLTWMKATEDSKVSRWLDYIQQFNITVKHIPGTQNALADCLSRSSQPDQDEVFVDEDPGLLPEAKATDVFLASSNESDATPWDILQIWRLPTTEELLQATQAEDISDDVRKLTERRPDNFRYNAKNGRLYVPLSLRERFLFWFHADRYGGHCGTNRTHNRMKKYLWWNNMHDDIRSYVKRCVVCQRTKPPVYKTIHGVLQKPAPFELVSCDFVGPRSIRGTVWHYLVILDHCTRFAVCVPAERETAAEAVSALRDHWVTKFGVPVALLSDRGASFTSQSFRTYVQGLGIRQIYSSPAYPQGNALNEASHKALEAGLRTRLQYDDKASFPELLAETTIVYNATPHAAIGDAPYTCLFGQNMLLPGWQAFIRDDADDVRYATMFDQRLRTMMRSILNQQTTLQLRSSNQYRVGDVVVYRLSPYEQKTLATDTSYGIEWSLPCRVLRVLGEALEVCPMHGSTQQSRQVPMTYVRRLQGPVPDSLRQMVTLNLERDLHVVQSRLLPDTSLASDRTTVVSQ